MNLAAFNQNKFVILVFAILSVLVLLWFGLRRFELSNLFFPEKEYMALPTAWLTFEEIFFETDDKIRISAWYFPGKSNNTVLYCHGNAGNISHRMEKIQMFTSIGLGVFIFDYRGYGKSQGRPSEKGTYRDGLAAYKYLVEKRKVSDGQIIFYGESLGGGVATELATRLPGRALILESPFTSVVAMGEHFYPFLPSRLIVSNHYDNLAKIDQVKMPVLIMHSPEDEIIPYPMAKTLFERAHEPKLFFELRGDHNGGYALTEGYLATIAAFLKSNG